MSSQHCKVVIKLCMCVTNCICSNQWNFFNTTKKVHWLEQIQLVNENARWNSEIRCMCVFIVALFGYTQLCTNTLLIKQKFYFHTWFNCNKYYFCIVNIAVTVYDVYLYNRILCLILYVLCYLCLYTVFWRWCCSEYWDLNLVC
jgi:hypothetical protein